MSHPAKEFLFVSGLSGAGKSVALNMLEDLGYYCIDNLPLVLADALNPTELAAGQPRYERVAVGIDARAVSSDIAGFPAQVDRLRDNNPQFVTRVLFFSAQDEVILRRFSETRRKHPLTDKETPLPEAIAKERLLLAPIAEYADLSFDTTHTNLHQLRERIQNSLSPGEGGELSILFQSFGFKFGMPDGLDLVFDVRCLPNPHWEKDLRPLSGFDPAVAEWLEHSSLVMEMFNDISGFLGRWLPRFCEQDRNYVTVGIGCTGGRHRSVYLVERLTQHFAAQYPVVLKRHTELP